MIEGRLKGVSRKFSVGFMAFGRNSKGISGKFKMCINGVLRKFQGCFKKDFRVVQERLKGISIEF